MVLYSSFSGVSLGRLLLAGFIPGFVIALFLMVDLYFSRESAHVGPAFVAFDWHRSWWTGRDAVLALIMPVIILGGMFRRRLHATEGAAVAVACAFVIGTVISRIDAAAKVFQARFENPP